ncbi:MAG: trehalose 6-phosphate synthase [Deltaproteobacteria bacterium]|nr:trehalose 6-phosphate synthase [Deltaproteobacteria bacterium]MBW2088092.1 trehalose 6-phosphate synthase [Deltaproteobacteria bacterium]
MKPTLKQFYDLMARTRGVRVTVVENIFMNRQISPDWIKSLKNFLAWLDGIGSENEKKILYLDDSIGNISKKIEVDLTYEITELEKDIFYLENGEQAFIDYLSGLHVGFQKHVYNGLNKLNGLNFNCFITDRDGTINNYCGRYRSSVQSIYNAVFLTKFAKKRVKNPIIITSAPLKDPGIVDVSVNPEKTIIYAASKGREFIDLSGNRRTYPISDKKQALIDRLNQKIGALLQEPSFEQFSLIGSGLQFKFGQTTIARQDISRSVSEDESEALLKRIRRLVSDIDPENRNFRIEDTGLDIEIILTIEDSESGPKDFDKADSVKFLDSELGLNLSEGPHLICGDTSSDIPMIEASISKTPDTWSIFVTEDKELAGRVAEVCPNAVIVPEPDMLVTILNLLSI